jgi:hypothetical protein
MQTTDLPENNVNVFSGDNEKNDCYQMQQWRVVVVKQR